MFELLRNIEFDQPWFLLLLVLVPGMIYYLYAYRDKSPTGALKVGSLQVKGGNKSMRVLALRFLPLLYLAGLTFLIFALARPQLALKEEEVTAEGIDIILALDLSSSMLAKDFQPDRLEVSKKVASDFVDKRQDDRIGLVVFSGESFTQCPLTSDHRIVKRFLSQLQCGFLEEGTAIGMGLATAVNRIKDSDAKSKVVILLTDGDNNTGYIRPLTAAEMARELDVTVYTIGVGSKGMALTPQGKRSDGSYVFDYARVMINEELLNQIAQITGGRYFRATSEESLGMVYNEIDQLEKTEREVTTFKRYSDEFPWFLRVGLILFLLHMILKLSVLRTYP
ncbi:MAG: VWA domain-containing protein [Saprospiraceae bacterium]|nr:VWA domain-containing protein [Saprospiraceae bacterium]